jgi:hypothetical protein
MRAHTWLAPAVLALTTAGCGSSNGLTMGRVYGTITYKGQPVTLGDVLFVPDTGKGTKGVPSMGKIDKDGRFVMSTQDAGDGVIAGFHKVGIRALDPTPISTTDVPEPVPGVSTGKEFFEARIKRGKSQAGRAKPKAQDERPTVSFHGTVYRFLAPARLADPEKSGIAVKIETGSNSLKFAIEEDGSVKTGD